MSCRLDSGTGRERLGNRNSGATYSRLFFSLFITSRNYLAGNSGVDDANDVWIYHRKDHIKQPHSRKSYAVEARFLLSGMIFIDLFYTIQVSKDFNGFVKTNAMIFPVAHGLFASHSNCRSIGQNIYQVYPAALRNQTARSRTASFATGDVRIVARTWSPDSAQLGASVRL